MSNDKLAEYKEKHCGCKDGHRYNSCKGLPNCELRDGHPEKKVAKSDGDEPPCRECGEHGCNGECYGDDMMGDSA